MPRNVWFFYKILLGFLLGMYIAKKLIFYDVQNSHDHHSKIAQHRRQDIMDILGDNDIAQIKKSKEDPLDENDEARAEFLENLRAMRESRLNQKKEVPKVGPPRIDIMNKLKQEQAAVVTDNVFKPKEESPKAFQDEQLPLQYTSATNPGHGSSFKVNPSLLSTMGLPPKEFTELSESTISDFVFAVPANNLTFYRSEAAVASIQEYFPKHDIVVIDLGLSASKAQEVMSWCNVQYELFPYSRYPEHVQDYRTYAWRPLAIQDLLQYHPAIFWVEVPFIADVSVLNDVLHRTLASGGLFTLKATGHSIYAGTSKAMYNVLPADEKRLQSIRMWSFTTSLMYNTKELYEGVLYWWYLCALDPECMSPPNITVPCPLIDHSPDRDQFTTYHNCHRHDQSSLNVLAAMHYDYRVSRYTMYQPEQFIELEQHYDKEFTQQAKTCKSRR